MMMLRSVRRWTLLCALAVAAACGGPPEGEPVRFTVPRGSGLGAVTDTLAAHDIVRQPFFFRLYARARGVAGSLKPGIYELRRNSEWDEVLSTLVEGRVVTLRITIPEGWTAQQIAARIAAETETPLDSVTALVFDTARADSLGVPGPTLEGYLYPATYVLPAGTPPAEIVRTMVRRYERAWTPGLRARADSAGLSQREVVTLASIVEKEAKVWQERDTIAAVYRNRLRIGMPLQADPTVQYARGTHEARLLYAHIEDVRDNPYNTYTHAGLPPGPIASPSEGSIRAVLYPAGVDFLYFVARPDGTHVFTRTLAEHNAAKRRSRAALDSLQIPATP
jgi:UPF0755 protein